MQRKVRGLLVITIGTTALGAFVFFDRVSMFLEQQGSYRAATLMTRGLRDYKEALLKLETGQRGFLLTGKVNYLAPYYEGEFELERSIASIRSLSERQFQAEKAMAHQLDAAAKRKRAELEKTILLRKDGRLQDALDIVQTDEGKRYMDEAMQLLDVATVKFRELRNQLDEKAARAASSAKLVFAVWILVLTILVGTTVLLLRKSQQILREATDQLSDLAVHDPLTGIPNRRYLDTWLPKAVGRAKRLHEGVTVLYLDLDGFSDVNNSHGHQTGDVLLVWAAETLQKLLRESDFLARWGGDEFVIVTQGMSEEQAEALAARVVQMVSTSKPPEPISRGTVGASVGIAMYPLHGNEAEELIEKADEAMYRAKKAGKRRFEFARVEEAATEI